MTESLIENKMIFSQIKKISGDSVNKLIFRDIQKRKKCMFPFVSILEAYPAS